MRRPVSLDLLLVDDEELDHLNAQRAFSPVAEHVTLHHAYDGVEALTLLRSGALRQERLVVLLDVHMPGLDGIELLRAIRRDPRLHRLPCVMLTTSTDERDRIEAYELHVAGFIHKPKDLVAFTELAHTFYGYWTIVELPDPGEP